MNKDVHKRRVGANILPAHEFDGIRSERQQGDWIIFGLAHTRLWTLKTYILFIKTMKSRGLLKRILAIGPVNNSYSNQEYQFAKDHLGENVLIQLGALPAEQVSEELLRAEVALIASSPEALKKSGLFAALAAHAVPVICDVPSNLSDPPAKALFKPAELMNKPEILRSPEYEKRKKQLHHWFWRTRNWKIVELNMKSWLKEG
ncbi:hypothetical protein B0I27_102268 [Arcticibacter pallidicorallinus]|uniref:Glycosyl transferase family 1 n=1 Tax=Arcticibacter pallidicorallinus TaxID=1259464 RepID=A0A2T0U991_9SPHI|nr:glycosyltransferase [Arcticibacter pallidicorallinus]PRY54501.1 hypothetical protein B0I27_102268 [Arcticibacter pallidicorallinus]